MVFVILLQFICLTTNNKCYTNIKLRVIERDIMKRALLLLIVITVLSVSGCTTSKPESDVVDAGDIPQKMTEVKVFEDIVIPSQTYIYEQMLGDAEKLAEEYPDLIKTGSIGKSVEGRELLLIKLGKGDKKILLAGAHHAREYITSTFLLETIDEYARRYTTDGAFGDYDVKSLLEKVTVYVVPMVNPDGVNLVQNGVESVKEPKKVKSMRMLQDSYAEWKANINGVDLNRQYPCHWDEKQSNTDVPSSEMYKGTAPATEPEVQALMALCEENDFLLAASFHTKGEVIYWADSGTQDSIAAGSSIAQTMADITGYDLMPVSEDPSIYAAGFENWFRQDFLRPAFCVELTPTGNGSTPHDDTEFDTLIWSKAKYLTAELITQALQEE